MSSIFTPPYTYLVKMHLEGFLVKICGHGPFDGLKGKSLSAQGRGQFSPLFLLRLIWLIMLFSQKITYLGLLIHRIVLQKSGDGIPVNSFSFQVKTQLPLTLFTPLGLHLSLIHIWSRPTCSTIPTLTIRSNFRPHLGKSR